jgi:hypothetical protein
MSLSINYQKRKNKDLFKALENHEQIQLSNCQNYIPLYKKFFALNESNYNSINLNHKWSLHKPTHVKNEETEDNKNVFRFIVKDITNEKSKETNVFLKMAPLLNPFKYLVGKYDVTDTTLFNLPSFNPADKVYPTMLDVNNSAYVDGYFTFLTSTLIHNHNFVHGVDYFGSFLAIKNNFMVDVIDDLDYLIESEFFVNNSNKLFTTEDYSHLMVNTSAGEKLKPIKIHDTNGDNSCNNDSKKSRVSNMSITSINDDLYEELFEPTVDGMTLNESQKHLTLDDLKDMSMEVVDITVQEETLSNENECEGESDKDENKYLNKSKSLKSASDSSCSSRTSHTNSNDVIDDDYSEEEEEEESDNNGSDGQSSSGDKGSPTKAGSQSNSTSNGSGSSSSFSDYEEEKLYTTINQFPVQAIAMEHCEDTFDNLVCNCDLTNDEWLSALMQIIMILITYQQAFSFTHNDLHTNNIMFNSTDVKYIFYLYKKKYYRVPTFGRIFKIIDYGRSIYKCNGRIFCSDSFQAGNDASAQYNTEPYFNESKPRLDPNYSFDLCRLACSLYDFIINDIDVKNISECEPHVRIIYEWCLDDNNLNVLYKTNGAERYPGFKLYKMISRCVHKHVPKAQLERKEFSKYIVPKTMVKKGDKIMDIDEIIHF